MTSRPVVGVYLLDDPIGAFVDGSGIAELAALIAAVERAGIDYVSLGDALLGSGDGVPRVTAGETLAYLARRTSQIALVPGVATHYVEPFHAAKQVATLDFVSEGRAGVLVQPERGLAADRLVPAASDLGTAELREQAAEFTHVLRQLWDSWEDGATVRDVVTGQYVDSLKVHPIEHDGRYFRVKGPLITPRPPQGQPPVFARVDTNTAEWRGSSVTTAPDVLIVAEGEVEAFLAAEIAADEQRVVVSIVASDAGADTLARTIERWTTTPGVSGVEVGIRSARLATLLTAGWVASETREEAGAVKRSLSDRLGIPRRASRYERPVFSPSA